MILRNLADAITKQNWFVVVIEVLVVVVGIMLGLQVDNWNQERRDRVDEHEFLQRLHGDLLIAEALSVRVRDRRVRRLQDLVDAGDVLFGRTERAELTEDECIAISSASFFNINASSLSSLEELMGTGRMGIIQSADLRISLLGLRQSRTALETMVFLQTGSAAFTTLPSSYPDLVTLTSYFDTELKEIRSRPECDLAGMRSNRPFLNDFSVDADGYDAYVRDGLMPWITQFNEVHALVDEAVDISHAEENED